MDSQLKTDWVAALRSRKYKQGRFYLKNFDDEYCCLGVLCDIIDSSKWEKTTKEKNPAWTSSNGEKLRTSFNNKDLEKIGLTEKEQDKLISLNDDNSATFSQIADYIEHNIK